METSKFKLDKKKYSIPIMKKIDSIKNKTLGTLRQGTKDGQTGREGRHS